MVSPRVATTAWLAMLAIVNVTLFVLVAALSLGTIRGQSDRVEHLAPDRPERQRGDEHKQGDVDDSQHRQPSGRRDPRAHHRTTVVCGPTTYRHNGNSSNGCGQQLA